ncbi:ArsR/SmtB family transcription factor [Kribbella solani]|uniref:ArsR/SmtB family transcription factor n=1 Tax=Kribbella solani TaxID=236067 RepID=UPI0029B8F0D4|nr:winged helix-turn-helix domain-containing protein [Kribbella solani]MDX2971233.1 winged helix-turn-helix domain-containing protein [Kribbella solani]
MITIRLSAGDVGRIRFALSPVWEAVTSVRALSNNTARSVHGPWLQKVRPVIEGDDLTLLRALIPSYGYIPDFLTPAPPRQSTSFESGLAAIAATPHDLVIDELSRLHHDTPHPLLPDLINRPAKALGLITTALETYWQRAIEPDWRRMRSLLQEDLAFRLDELASGGIERLFRNLHPSISYSSDRIEINRPFCCDGEPMTGQGVLLVPCVFTWPAGLAVTGAPHVPTITYPPRGLGRLWEDRQDTTDSPLADLVGRTRAAIVSHLDLPMSTTHLAHQLGLSAPTLSVHLTILRNAGVVTSRRDGRAVLYHRTPLGNQLLTAATSFASSA